MKTEHLLILAGIGFAGWYIYNNHWEDLPFFGSEPPENVPDGGVPVGTTPGSYSAQGLPVQSPSVVQEVQPPLAPVVVHPTREIIPFEPDRTANRPQPVRGRSRTGNIPVGILEGFSGG